MIKFIKQLWCKHVYEPKGTYVDGVGKKNKLHVCNHCGKVKWESI